MAQLVDALSYNPEDRGFDRRWCHWHNPSGRTTVVGSTQQLTEMRTRNISWGIKAAGVLGWQSYQLHVPTVLKSGSLNLLETSGPVQACNGTALPSRQLRAGFLLSNHRFYNTWQHVSTWYSIIKRRRYKIITVFLLYFTFTRWWPLRSKHVRYCIEDIVRVI